MKLLSTWLKTDSSLHIGILCALVLFGTGIRIYYTAVTPILGDESETYFNYVSQPFSVTVSLYDQPNNHMLNSLLAHLSIALFGDHLWALRLPALLSGILVVPLTYLLARQVYDKESGLLATGFVATAPGLIHMSTNARGYPIATALFMLQCILAYQYFVSQNRKTLLLISLTGALQLYTMPSSLYAVGIPVLWIATAMILKLRSLPVRVLLELLLCFAGMLLLTLLFYIPVLMRDGVFGILNTIAAYSKEPLPITQIPYIYYGVATKFFNEGVRAHYPVYIAVLLGGSTLVALASHLRIARDKMPMLITAVFWAAPILAIQRFIPFARLWTFLYPILFITAAAGIVFLLSRWQRAIPLSPLVSVALSILLGWMLISNHWPFLSMAYGWGYPRVPEAVTDIESLLHSDDVIADVGLITVNPLRYYFKQERLETAFVSSDPSIPLTVDQHPKRLFVIVPIENNDASPLDQIVKDIPEADFFHQIKVLELLKSNVYSTATLIGTYDNFAVFLVEE